jgi:hypothetical protein
MYNWSVNPVTNPNPVYIHNHMRENILSMFYDGRIASRLIDHDLGDYPVILPEGPKQTTECISEDSQYLGRETIRARHDCKSRALRLQ